MVYYISVQYTQEPSYFQQELLMNIVNMPLEENNATARPLTHKVHWWGVHANVAVPKSSCLSALPLH